MTVTDRLKCIIKILEEFKHDVMMIVLFKSNTSRKRHKAIYFYV